MLESRARRALSPAFLLLNASLLLSSPVYADPPSTERCLEASDASIELEKREKLLDTREALRTCAALNCPEQVREECTRRLELVEQNIPSVRCEVVDEAGRVLHDALVTVDGVGTTAIPQEPIELEPGRHTLAAQNPGMLTLERSINLKARQKNRPLRFVLKPSPDRRGYFASLPPRRTAALVATGVGAASLATAAVFGILALQRKQDARAICPSATCDSASGEERWHSAWQAGNFSTAFAAGGALALAAAVGLWFSVDGRSTRVAVGPAELRLDARF